MFRILWDEMCYIISNYYVFNCSFKNACLDFWHREASIPEAKSEAYVKAIVRCFNEVLPRLYSLKNFLKKCVLPDSSFLSSNSSGNMV